MKNKKRKIFVAIMLVISGVLLVGYLQGERIEVTRYQFDVPQVDAQHRVKIAHLTDVHSLQDEQRKNELLNILEQEKPTHIVLTGDIITLRVTKQYPTPIYPFLEKLTKLAPVYFVSGNHEYDDGTYNLKVNKLLEMGVYVLNNEKADINEQVRFIGVEDVGRVSSHKEDVADKKQMEHRIAQAAERYVDKSKYNVLLYHRPHYTEAFQKGGYNLVLTGHVHGGQWQDPTHTFAAIGPDQGYFPKYFKGQYHFGATTVISNRGLDFTMRMPRFYNAREIAFIDIQ